MTGNYKLQALLLLSLLHLQTGAEECSWKDPNLFHFVTRPDLQPPKWEITIYNESALSLGYWFVAPKQTDHQTIGSGAAWTGPAIYEQKGELVWSGTSQLDSPNVNDFRVNEVDEVPMLTMLDRDRQSGVFLDSSYRVHKVLDIVGEKEGEELNGHELRVVNDGGSVLVIRNHERPATQREKDAVGFKGNVCRVNYMKLVELDLTTGEEVFEFDPRGRIGIDESTLIDLKNPDANSQCEIGWDYMHANSAHKCDDGHYLYSARHTDTIYKISKDDGSIIWRLGGLKSDFTFHDFGFSRQHDVQCRSQNATHTIISILDNAKGEDDAPPSHAASRGLLIELDTVNMSASLLAHFDHPEKTHARRRGNMQILRNDNVFMGWSERALQSEYSADGTLLMKAQLKTDWLGSYRNYKFDFVGRPLTRPDVSAAVYFRREDTPITKVYVSWNGDTRVRTWKLYARTADAEKEKLVAEVERAGFETYLEWPKYASYVRLEGVDERWHVVGDSSIIKTVEHPSEPDNDTANSAHRITRHNHNANRMEFHDDL